MKKSDKPGAAFHRLIAAIEGSIAGDENCTVEHGKKLRDQDTGQPREHDVLITIRRAHHELVTAIECRDRSRKVGVPDVEQFEAKCRRTGVHKGIMVSPKGFARTALRKAAEMHIGCMTLDDAEQFAWCQMTFVTDHRRWTKQAELIAEPVGIDGAKLFRTPDIEIDDAELIEMAREALTNSDAASNWQPGLHTAEFTLNSDFFFWKLPSGEKRGVGPIGLRIQYETIEQRSPIKFQQYQTQDGQSAAGVASAQVEGGQLLFVNEPSGETKVLMLIDR